MRKLLLLSAVALAAVAAQDAMIGIPRLSLMFDGAGRGFRAINGTPGAAMIGEFIAPGVDLQDAAISADQRFALARSAGDNQLYLLRWTQSGLTSEALNGAGGIDMYALSPSSSSAALHDSSTGRVVVVTGLPDAPRFLGAIESSLPDIVSLAVSDDGAVVCAMRSGDNGKSLWRLAAEAPSLQFAVTGSIFATAFRGSSHDMLAITAEGAFLITQIDSNPNYLQFNPADVPFADTIAVHFGATGDRAYLLSSKGVATILDTTGGYATSAKCDCTPDGLWRTATPNVFRIAGTAAPIMMLLDGSNAEPRFLFVPRNTEEPR
jgi:hypothetical protein